MARIPSLTTAIAASLCVMAGSVYAQTASTTTSPTPQATTTTDTTSVSDAAPQAQTTSGSTKPNARPVSKDSVHGHVVSIDTAGKTITIADNREPSPTTFAVTDSTVITLTEHVGLDALKTGQAVRVTDPGIAAGTAKVTATTIELLDAIRPHGRNSTVSGYRPNTVEGTITALSPTLTIITPGQITVTVETTSRTSVITRGPATFDQIAVGSHIQARLASGATTPTATEIHIQPDFGAHDRSADIH